MSWLRNPRKAARRELRKLKTFYSPRRFVPRAIFNEPTWGHLRKKVAGPTRVASIKRDPATGKTTSKGVRRTADGWAATPKRTSKSKRAKQKTGTERRADERAAARRSARTPARKPRATSGNGSLARDYDQAPGGRMNGSAAGKTGLPTVRQATGLTRLNCPWCRSSGQRPIFTGAGQLKTVVAVLPCNHRWSSRDGGPAQEPAAPGDKFLCPPCQNTGTFTMKTRARDGSTVTHQQLCPTCVGWIIHW